MNNFQNMNYLPAFFTNLQRASNDSGEINTLELGDPF